jgi:solute carrier family 25 (mitochondrial carnitine/acylcarnitine transporter), member 20/29
MTYNRSLKKLEPSIIDPTKLNGVPMYKIWFAGAIGGLASWVVSAPSELIKCRTQLHEANKTNSLIVFKHVWGDRGLQGLFLGGPVTSVRDSVGYGFYFSSYELCRRLFSARRTDSVSDAADFDVLVSGGIAGIITWASIYPLDVIKTRIQAEGWKGKQKQSQPPTSSALEMARNIIRREGVRAVYRGLAICSVRAFFVNAIQVSLHSPLTFSHKLTSRSGTLMRRSWHSSLLPAPHKMPRAHHNQSPLLTRESHRLPGDRGANQKLFILSFHDLDRLECQYDWQTNSTLPEAILRRSNLMACTTQVMFVGWSFLSHKIRDLKAKQKERLQGCGKTSSQQFSNFVAELFKLSCEALRRCPRPALDAFHYLSRSPPPPQRFFGYVLLL